MGRAPLILILFLATFIAFFIAFTAQASDVSYSDNLKKYYFGGEYVYFFTKIKPEEGEVKAFDGKYYKIRTSLDDSGIYVEIKLSSGREVFHPTPKDEYVFENGTLLKFYLPESDGVEYVLVRIFGYIPEVEKRIENVTAVVVYVGSEIVAEKKLTVVNKGEFYQDIKDLQKSKCAKKFENALAELLSLYYEGKYLEANRRIMDIESKIRECEIKSELGKLKENITTLKSELISVKKNLSIIEFKLEVYRDSLQNFEALNLKLQNLSLMYEEVDNSLERARDLIYEGKLIEAKQEVKNAKSKIEELKDGVSELLLSVEKSKGFNISFTTPAVMAAAIVAAAASGVIAARFYYKRKEKW